MQSYPKFMFKNHAIGGNDSSVVKSQAVIPQDPSSLPATYRGWLIATYNSRSRESNTEKQAVLTHTHARAHTQGHTHREIFKNKLPKLSQKS